jgi:hypothetical protein
MELTVETRVVCSQDNYSYAAFPSGVAAGTSFQHLYGQQWGALSKVTTPMQTSLFIRLTALLYDAWSSRPDLT